MRKLTLNFKITTKTNTYYSLSLLSHPKNHFYETDVTSVRQTIIAPIYASYFDLSQLTHI